MAVVGAGAAGVTAATALRGLGVERSDVFDEAAVPMHAQRASFTRFLHPTFHWPEAGWKNPTADLPVGGWDAGYADEVRRSEVLRSCGGARLRYCATVEDITTAPSGEVRLHLRRLEEHAATSELFDLVIVAADFPAEQSPDGVSGGSYWHAIEVLGDKPGDVHIIGDGDGALTEDLLLYIDLLGHGAVTELATMCPPLMSFVGTISKSRAVRRGQPQHRAQRR